MTFFYNNLTVDWVVLEIFKQVFVELPIFCGLVHVILALMTKEWTQFTEFSKISGFWYLSKYFLDQKCWFENGLFNMTVYFSLIKLTNGFFFSCIKNELHFL